MQSDRFRSADEFLLEFFDTFDSDVRRFSHALEFFSNTPHGELEDALWAADSSDELVQCALELTGRTPSEFLAADHDSEALDLRNELLSSTSVAAAHRLVEVSSETGIGKSLSRRECSDLLSGVQLRLATTRRKDKGGRYFQDQVRQLLERVLSELAHDHSGLRLEKEYLLGDSEGNSKRVDLCVVKDSRPRVAVEVNFYTVSGSKPTEIKRSYGHVRQWMTSTHVELVWITDGKGYRKMHRSLKEAFLILPNTYNFSMADRYLAEDLRQMLGEG